MAFFLETLSPLYYLKDLFQVKLQSDVLVC